MFDPSLQAVPEENDAQLDGTARRRNIYSQTVREWFPDDAEGDAWLVGINAASGPFLGANELIMVGWELQAAKLAVRPDQLDYVQDLRREYREALSEYSVGSA